MAASSSSSGNLTTTQLQQVELESKVGSIFGTFASLGPPQRSALLELWMEEHGEFLRKGLRRLGVSYAVLDSSRPWLCYWILHSLALLGEQFNSELEDDVIKFLERCQDDDGGYGGGPGQMPHLATTYAAVSALVTLGGPRALGSIDREKLLQFLMRMKDISGGFRLHEGGEMDVRGCYTAIAVAHILGVLTPALKHKVNEYVASCQTYEGGIGCEPGSEAHGGYTFCGLAALILTDQLDGLDLPRLLKWAASRQGRVEGGFQGRTNKLVDGCYSYWQGGVFPLIQHVIPQLLAQLPGFQNHLINLTEGKDVLHTRCEMERFIQMEKIGSMNVNSKISHVHGKDDETISESNLHSTKTHSQEQRSPPVMSAETLFPVPKSKFTTVCHGPHQHTANPQQHGREGGCSIEPLFNTQALQAYILLCCQVLDGGLIDKPGKSRDYYHTCYCLSGLSIAQHPAFLHVEACPHERDILGPSCNLLEATHPLCNVHFERYLEARSFFQDI